MDVPIVPQQSNPPLVNGLFGRDWYLFYQAVRDSAATGGGIVQFGTSASRKALDTQGIPNGTLWIETDTGLIYQWQVKQSPASMGWVWIFGTQLIDQVLKSTSSTIQAPTTGAGALDVILRPDGSGAPSPLWGTGFSGVSSDIDTSANTITTFHFRLSGGKYVQIGQHTTGMAA